MRGVEAKSSMQVNSGLRRAIRTREMLQIAGTEHIHFRRSRDAHGATLQASHKSRIDTFIDRKRKHQEPAFPNPLRSSLTCDSAHGSEASRRLSNGGAPLKLTLGRKAECGLSKLSVSWNRFFWPARAINEI